MQTLIDMLRRHADATPDRNLYTFLPDDGPLETLTFTELDRRARTLGAAISEVARPGDRVLLWYPSGLEFISAFLGCLYAGVIAVPAYPPRRNRSAERLEAIAGDAQPTAVLMTQEVARTLEVVPVAGQAICPVQESPSESNSSHGVTRLLAQAGLRHFVLTDLIATEANLTWQAPSLSSNAVAFLQYTSGSTGTPKGVIVTHANLMANERCIQAGFGHSQDSVVVGWLPMFHDMGLIGNVLQPVFVGIPAVLMAPNTFVRDPVRWLRAISDFRGTTSGAPNFAYDLCVKNVREEAKQGLDLSSWQIAFNGAEPVRAATLERFSAAFGGCGFRRDSFFPCYGMAETTLFVSGGNKSWSPTVLDVDSNVLEQQRIQPAPNGNAVATRALVGCGVTWCDTRVEIFDPETGRPSEPDTVGEIWVSGGSVARGYWNRPEESRQTFGTRLTGEMNGTFLRTGDLGFKRDGEVFITGRLKNLIIIRGRNLYPQDVEAAVESVVPFAAANKVAAFSLDVDGEERLAVCLEADRELVRLARAHEKSGQSASFPEAEALIQEIQTVVATEFEVGVHAVAFVRPGAFPVTSSGKVQRRACRELLQSGSEDLIYVWEATRSQIRERSDGGQAASAATSAPSMVKTSATESREKADEIIDWLRDYAARRLNSRLMDERRTIAPYVVLDFGNQGLFGLQVPRCYGGLDLHNTDMLRIFEQLAAIDLSLASMVGNHNGLGLRPILNFGSEALRQELLPLLATGRQLAAFGLTEPEAGSNPQAMESHAQAVEGGWRVNARKQWIGLASWSSVITVFAKAFDSSGSPLGLIALAVRQDTKGLRHGPEAVTMGLRGVVQNTVFLEDAFIPESDVLGQVGAGMQVAQDAMKHCRLGIAAGSVGGMKRCVQLMARYGDRRTISTGRLGENPVSLNRLQEITHAIDATDALVQSVARQLDAGEEVPVELYMACKTSGPEFLWQTVDQALQMLGGRGYIETNLLPQMLRDARLLRIYEGPTETLNSFLGANVLQRREEICRWLADHFGASTAASALNQVAEQLADVLAKSGSTTGHVALRNWVAFQLGELTTAAILWAAVVQRFGDATVPHDAIEWVARRFERLRDAALSAGTRDGISRAGSALDHRLSEYEHTIGDVEQSLPGEDHLLDPYLSKATASPAETSAGTILKQPPSRRVTVASVADDDILQAIHDTVLAWVHQEVDANLRSIDPDKSFMSLGVDSIGATAIAVELEKLTGLDLNPEVVYEYRTLRELAGYISQRQHRATRSEPIDHVKYFLSRNQRVDQMIGSSLYFYESTFDRVEGAIAEVADTRMVIFSTYSYLGLIGHPEVNQAARSALEQFGTGTHGVRLLAGTTRLHRQLERELAEFMQSEDAIVFNTGYVANFSTVGCLVGEGDVVIGDELNHASIQEGCQLSQATFLSFRHNDLRDLERCLQEAGDRRILVVVDAVYSMEGDIADLPEIVKLCRRHNALLMVDEAHSFGVLGATGRGVQEYFNLPPDAIDIKMGTLSKAIAANGGFIAARSPIIRFLKHQARGFVFSGALPAPTVAAARSCLQILQREPERVARLQSNTRYFLDRARQAGLKIPDTQSPIIPILFPDEESTLQMTLRCRQDAVFVTPIFYPAVPMDAPRLRCTVTAAHTHEELDYVLKVLTRAGRELGVLPTDPESLNPSVFAST